jgi:hypothetical protein
LVNDISCRYRNVIKSNTAIIYLCEDVDILKYVRNHDIKETGNVPDELSEVPAPSAT